MFAFVFQESKMLLLLLLVPVLITLFVYASRKRRRAVGVFSSVGSNWARRFLVRRNIQAVAICFAVISLILALARPGWNPMKQKVTRDSRDVIFVLDASRSMLARDQKPDRLTQAKAMIRACVSRLDENQRLALVVFAGSSSIQCPLASDRRFFESALEQVGPNMVAQGGTRIGDALRRVSDKLLTKEMFGFQDVILITDGGDQESDPSGSAGELNELGASLMIIGMGTDGTGARIPVVDSGGGADGGFLLHEGREVWTKLETKELEEILRVIVPGRGLFHTGSAAEAAEKYLRFTEHLAGRQIEVELAERYEEGFPWFVGLAVIFLLIGLIARIPPRRIPSVPASAISVVIALAAFQGTAAGAGAAEAGQNSASRFDFLWSWLPDFDLSALETFNTGNALLEIGDYSSAFSSYEKVVKDRNCPEELRKKSFFNMGHCMFRIAAKEEEVLADISAVDAVDVEDEGAEELNSGIVASLYEESAINFRAALVIDRSDMDAARNMELARYNAERMRAPREDDDGVPPNEEGNEGEKSETESEHGDEGQDGDSEETEPGEEFEEGESEDGDPSQLGRSQTTLTDLNNQALPPPNLAPEDLLNEEILNNEIRDKASGRTGRPVERDW